MSDDTTPNHPRPEDSGDIVPDTSSLPSKDRIADAAKAKTEMDRITKDARVGTFAQSIRKNPKVFDQIDQLSKSIAPDLTSFKAAQAALGKQMLEGSDIGIPTVPGPSIAIGDPGPANVRRTADNTQLMADGLTALGQVTVATAEAQAQDRQDAQDFRKAQKRYMAASLAVALIVGTIALLAFLGVGPDTSTEPALTSTTIITTTTLP